MSASNSEQGSGRCGCTKCRAHDEGRFGPYSPREFSALFGAVNEPGPVEVPSELVELGLAADAAASARDGVAVRIADAVLARYRLAPADVAGRDAADAALEDLVGLLEGEDQRLAVARAAYNDAARRVSVARAAREYAESVEARRVEAEAEREVALSGRSTLARIRQRVTR